MRELPAIEAAYTELANDLDLKRDAARDRGDGPAIDWLDKRRAIDDSAYFILAWGQLEQAINLACEAAVRAHRSSVDWFERRAWDAHNPDDMRAKFEDRAALVLDRSNVRSDAYRRTIRYCGQRNRIAHGQTLATGIDVTSIISDLYRIGSEITSR